MSGSAQLGVARMPLVVFSRGLLGVCRSHFRDNAARVNIRMGPGRLPTVKAFHTGWISYDILKDIVRSSM